MYIRKQTKEKSVCGNEAYQYLHYINSRGCAKEQKSEKLSWKKKTLHTNSRFAYLYPRITSLHFRPSRLIHTNLLYKFLDWSLSWMLYLLLVSQALCTMLSYDHKKKNTQNKSGLTLISNLHPHDCITKTPETDTVHWTISPRAALIQYSVQNYSLWFTFLSSLLNQVLIVNMNWLDLT